MEKDPQGVKRKSGKLHSPLINWNKTVLRLLTRATHQVNTVTTHFNYNCGSFFFYFKFHLCIKYLSLKSFLSTHTHTLPEATRCKYNLCEV